MIGPDSLTFRDELIPQLSRDRGPSDRLGPVGIYDFTLVRAGKVIFEDRFYNAITNEGKNNILNRFFKGTGTNTTSWFFGLVDGATFSSVNASDTMLSHPGWTEFIDYSGERKAWGHGTATGQQITNASPFTFTFTNGTPTDLWGVFLCTETVKSGTIGTLWNTAPFNSLLPVQQDDVLNCSYTLQL